MLDLGRPPRSNASSTGLPAPVDHVLVTGGGPPYAPLRDIDFDEAERVLDEHLLGCRCGWPARASGGFDPAVR